MKRLSYLFYLVAISCLYTSSNPVKVASYFLPTASIFRVNGVSGNDGAGCGSEAQPCRTIQYAVNLAASGDTILVAGSPGGITYTYNPATDNCSGTYGSTGVICLFNKQLTILGGYASGNWSAANPATNLTLIDGQNTYRGVFVFRAGGDTSLYLDGFIIQNGRSRGIPARQGDDKIFAFGGGLFADSVNQLALKNIIFRNNQSIGENTNTNYGGSGAGGALALRASPNVYLENVTFDGNLAQGGSSPGRGGYAVGGAWHTHLSVVYGTNLTFTNNTAVGGNSSGSGIFNGELGDALGGALALQYTNNVTLENVVATGNQAIGGNSPNGDGSGAYAGAFYGEESIFTLRNIFAAENLAQGGDGINNNVPVSGAALAMGGAIMTLNSDLILAQITAVHNTAVGGDGQTYMGSAGGGGITIVCLSGECVTEISNTIIADNTAALGGGSQTPGGGGGGLWLQGVNANIIHSTIARNHLNHFSMLGQGVVLLNFGAPSPAIADFDYTIFADHTNNDNAATIHNMPGNTVNLNTGLFAGNSKNTNADGIPLPSGTFNGLSSMLNAGSAGFVSPGGPNYDYRLLSTSTAINQAAGSITPYDFEGDSRLLFAPADIGADEFAPIALSAIPSADGELTLRWEAEEALMPNLSYYQVAYELGPGANPPNEGTSPINVGTASDFTLTGLTNGASYTLTIHARNSSGGLIAISNTVVAIPADHFVYLPLALSR